MSASLPLFADLPVPRGREELTPGACVLRGFALAAMPELWAGIQTIERAAPFRHLVTPGGKTMSVAMTNCGAVGWVSDRRGYRYQATDPVSGQPWPEMPPAFLAVAQAAAAEAGFVSYAPEVCLVNRYGVGTRLTLHQDHDEHDRIAPIVSVSLGLAATFLWGGLARADRQRRIPLAHGDVVVWGGPARMTYHGVAPIKPGQHALTGERRYNLTFRVAH